MHRAIATTLFVLLSFSLLIIAVRKESAAIHPPRPGVTLKATTPPTTEKKTSSKRRGALSLPAQTSCGNVQLQLTPDYGFAVGSSSGGTDYTFALNGQPLAQGALTQRALFHYDNALASTSGIAPLRAEGTSLVPGKWGSALAIAAGGIASYPAPGNISFNDGTIELWFAPTKDGTDPIYSQYDHTLFRYLAANGDQLVLSESFNGGFYAGTIIGGNFTGMGGIQMSTLKASVWHHLAFSYSKTNGRLRVYLDGVQTGERVGAFTMPASDGSAFTINSNPFGRASAFLIDELRISADEKTAEQIRYDATRLPTFADNEVLLPLTGVAPGQLSYAVSGCGTASYSWTGIPITNFNPGSNLLAPSSTSVNLTFDTAQASSCAYSVGTLKDYNQMTPFANGQGTTVHQGTITGLSPDPRVLNKVFLRCSLAPDYVQQLEYRSIAAVTAPFPRIGNLWFGGSLFAKKPELAKKVSLFLSPNLTVNQANALRAANPQMVALAGLGATYTPPPSFAVTPKEYMLKDVHGTPIEIWASTIPLIVLNLTKPEVAEWAANNLFRQLAESHFAYDGVFLDSVGLRISWLKNDSKGNPIQIDANEDGIADDPATLDAAWRAGMLRELDTLRKVAPYAYLSCHCAQGDELIPRFNGWSDVFTAVNVREGRTLFATFWDQYNKWMTNAQAPVVVNVQSAPPDQLAYGYGTPMRAIPPDVAEFGRTFYPYMRFGLATALMRDGYFYHDFGDATPEVLWWYDEYDFSLGYPLGPAVRLSPDESVNLIRNGGFENSLTGTWRLNVFNNGQAKASVALDSTNAAKGNSAVRVTVESVSTVNWHINLNQQNLPLVAGTNYQFQFWARADSPRTMVINLQGTSQPPTFYGLSARVALETNWKLYSVPFVASRTANDGVLEFYFADQTGNVWLDEVSLAPAPPSIYRRDFTHGVVLLNGTNGPQTISLESGLRRFTGDQAPKYQYIVDDAEASFTTNGTWNSPQYDSGVLWGNSQPTSPAQVSGPFYHAWQGKVHQLDATSGTAQWNLNLPADGRYTIQVWLPAAPTANTWTKNAVYEIISGGNVLASATLDQTTAKAGDGWHTIATNLALTAAGAPVLRVRNGAAAGALIADAVYVTSAALYNDGSPAAQVTLAPMDGILLQRQQPVSAVAVVNAANYQAVLASGAIVSGFGQNLATGSGPALTLPLPTTLFGTTVTVKDAAGVTRPAPLFYVSPGQVNYLIPEGTATGPATVIITSSDGAVSMGIVLIEAVAPALFTASQDGKGAPAAYAIRVKANGEQVREPVFTFDPNTGKPLPAPIDLGPPDEVIVLELYGTGIRGRSSQAAVSALIGGIAGEVQYASAQPGYVGLDQVNVRVPRSLIGRGEVDLMLTVEGKAANPVRLSFK